MKILLLANDRRIREAVVAGLAAGIEALAVPTVSDAEYSLAGRAFDLVVIDTKVYPGFGSRDAVIQELARVLPTICYSENLAYWQVGLRAVEMVRGEESANAKTTILLRFPKLVKTEVGIQDVLTEEAVLEDLKDKGPIEPLFGVSVAELIERVNSFLQPSRL